MTREIRMRSGVVQRSNAPVRGLAAVGLGLTLLGCGSAQIAGRRDVAVAPAAPPAVVYVTDFELDAKDIQSERTLLPAPPPPPGPLGAVLPKLPGTPTAPAVRARELVELMSTSLVDRLTKAGLPTQRLAAGAPRPAGGWLVRGVFVQVDEGNRLRRALIGFGAGETQMDVVVAVDDLRQGVPQPLYEVVTTADSGKAPGAAPMIVLSPVGAAARFALSGRDLERNVKQTAAEIATDLAARVQR